MIAAAFAAFYFALSVENTCAFTKKLDVMDSLYFSVITATTVGYGDISPVSTAAKLGVMCEVLFGFVFVVFLLATVVSVWQEAHIRTIQRTANPAPDPNTGKASK